jgi:hypothetical protein
MSKAIDMTGTTVGRLTVVQRSTKQGRGIFWECSCSCGKNVVVHGSKMRSGHTQSCGCLHYEQFRPQIKDLTGKSFGRLLVLERSAHPDRFRKASYLCECLCGRRIICEGSNLLNSHTQSCGCILSEMKGENHPSWNPLLTDEDRKNRRNSSAVENWRTQVFARDGYTCQVCHRKGVYLNAHHKDGWCWCVDRRFDVDNGISLCKECHNLFHASYGRTNNTESQFNEWSKSVKSSTTK